MGNNEQPKPTKSDKSSSPAPPDQTNVPVYPDWAAMQAYYGPRLPMPVYYNSPMPSGHHHPPYMWGSQPMMPPYGAPYAALYPHGGVYGHTVPAGSQPQAQKVPSSAVAPGTPLSIDAPTRSTGNTDNGLMKKLKEFDGLAMSIGNGHAENGTEHKHSQSSETDGSTDGSDGNTTGTNQTPRKRSQEGIPIKGSIQEKPVLGTVLSPGALQPLAMVPSESWVQSERELKRQRRKQSNRESARRSRLRKQAETEELAHKVESLVAENTALRSEVNQLTEKSEKLRLENAALQGQLKKSDLGDGGDIVPNKAVMHDNTENLLSRVNNSGSVVDQNGNKQDSNSNTSKMHQRMDTTSSLADAVAAG